MTSMRLCFAFLVLLVLPSACLKSVCPTCPTCPVATAGEDCGPPPIADPDWTMRDDRPDLPEGLACLKDPLAVPASYLIVNAPFRDPEHCWTPNMHRGTDLRAKADTPVVASAAGEVVDVRQQHGETWSVEVRFGDGWSYRPAHLREIAVALGDKVEAGDVLGWSGGERKQPGSGPYTTGPHLHFELVYQGAYVDAEKYFCRSYARSTATRTCLKVCQ
ncbi:MAG: M23 family metallopeptidase [Patescibacteria group bacterium]|nr:MAG: M23 family metallopeptidase [Patescibacteria group bacterium]